MSDPSGLVAEAERDLQPLELAAGLTWWAVSTEATDEHARAREAADIALSDRLADPDLFAAVRAARAEHADDPTLDPLAARGLQVLHDRCLPHQVPPELRRRMVELQVSVESTFNRHRGVVRGEEVDDNAIKRILRTSADQAERRDAWEASKTVGAAVAGEVRELARLRNDAARRLGFRDYFAMALATDELDEQRLFATLDAVDAVTAEPFRRWKAELDSRLAQRYGCDESDLQPFHLSDPFFQEPPVEATVDLDEHFAGRDLVGLTQRTFTGIGLDSAAILERSDLFPRHAKSQHAFCIDIDRAGDVRVLANVVDNEQWMETMLHEVGHAVHFTGIDPSLPWLLRDLQSLTTEGVAMLFGRLVHDPEWLGAVAGLSPHDVDALTPRLADARRAARLVFARWVLVMTHFERGLYADPDGDHDTRWWDLVHRYQLVRPPHDRHAPDWAAKIHLAVAPVYYHNYLYGELVASQLQHTLRTEAGGIVDRPEAGRHLVERFFAPAVSLRWDRLVERATGEPLTPDHLARELEH